MAAKGSKRTRLDLSLFPAPESVLGQRYYYVTQRPWPSLVFILPMLLLFEVYTYLRTGGGSEGGSELVAEWLIVSTANIIGSGGFYFPGLLTIVILVGWHVAARHPWRFDPWVLPGMLGESLLWTVPLFVYNQVLQTALVAGSEEGGGRWLDQIVRSLGAGIYEELVFRLIAITILVIVFVDVLRMPRSMAALVIMLAAAALFAASHHYPLGNEPFDRVRFFFRTGAGLYLAGLFVFRGFGVAAGTHALYNVIVVTVDAVPN